MAKRDGTKRKRSDAQSWDKSQGWHRVDIGDELLIGSEEGGFLELEEFKPPAGTIISSEALGAEDAPSQAPKPAKKTRKAKAEIASLEQPSSKAASDSQNAKPTAKGKLKAKTGKAKVAADVKQQQEEQHPQPIAGNGEDADVAALKAELAALKEENQRLKEDRQPGAKNRKPPDPNSARSAKLAAKRAKAKEVRQAKKAAAKARDRKSVV